VAPPGNQAATEKTNINLYHSENPVYSPKVGQDFPGEAFRLLKEKEERKYGKYRTTRLAWPIFT
jgi:hypothetical protein